MTDYDEHVHKVILAMSQDPLLYATADQLAAELIPNHPSNDKVMRALVNGKGRISPRQLEVALARKLKAEIRAERAEAAAEAKARHQENVLALLGRHVQTERELIPAFLETGGWSMSYSKEFTNGEGRTLTAGDILDEIQLAAAELRLTKKPLELRERNIERALDVYCRDERAARKDAVWDNIRQPSNGRVAADVIAEFVRICSYYLRDGEMGAAAIMKVIWSVKRKMQRLVVPYHHCVVLFGAQGAGKSTFWTFLKVAIQDFCKDVADVTDLLSNSQLDLFSYLLTEIPELSGIEKASVAKFKSVITAPMVSRRVFHTQNMRDVFMASTFIGTTNVPLDSLFKDSTGMRRFVQVDVKEFDEISPYWQQIVHFDYLGLWQAVDHLGPDPLEPFRSELHRQQEEMRTKDRVEAWLDDFALDTPPLGYHVATSEPPHLFQYPAAALFKLFKIYEAWAFGGGNGMALTTWGLRMKALIDTRIAKDWEYQTHGRRTLYTYHKSIVISLCAPGQT